MAIQHSNIADADRHEAKGASTATLGQVLRSDGDGTTSFKLPIRTGWYNYEDTLTQTTPIPLTTAGTYYDLTNNAAGVNTNVAYGISGISTIWNNTTNRFNYSSIPIGSMLETRIDVTFTTTSANTAVDLVLEFGVGTGTPVLIPFLVAQNFKTAGTYQRVVSVPYFIGSALVQGNPARIKARADTAGATVKVAGWYTTITLREEA